MTTPDFPDDVYDDSIDINLRSIDEIGRRLVLLATIGRRGLLDFELAAAENDAESIEEREATAYDLRNWAEEQGLFSVAVPDEINLLTQDHHSPDEEEVMLASRSLDSMITLSWAAGLVSPRWDETDDALFNSLMERIPEPWEDVNEFMGTLGMRELEEIAAERERAELWLWRAQIEPERRAAKGPERREIGETIAETIVEGIDLGLLPDKDVNDFIWKGKPVRGLTVAENEDLELDAETALLALNWICGFGESWDDVPLVV